jgi:hypothetical protein
MSDFRKFCFGANVAVCLFGIFKATGTLTPNAQANPELACIAFMLIFGCSTVAVFGGGK